NAPLFSFHAVSDAGPYSHPSGSRPWEISKRELFPPLAIKLAPENCRYHAASKVIGSQIQWLSFSGVQPHGASRRGRTSESQPCELCLRDGTAANQTLWV